MVTQESIFEKIGGLLQELTDQYAFLKQHPSEQKGVHLELFEANITYLLGHATILQKLTSIDGNTDEIKSNREEPGSEGSIFSEEENNVAEADDTVLSSLREEESALNYVDSQEVKETYFTPATANPEEKAEEYKLEDKRDKKEEETKEEAVEDAKASDSSRNEEEGENHLEASNGEKEEVISNEAEDADEAETETAKVAEEQEKEAIAQEEQKAPEQPVKPEVRQVIEEEKSVVVPINEVQQEEPKPVTPTQEPKRPMTLNELFSAQRKQQEQHKFPGQQPDVATRTAANLQESPMATKRITDIKSAVSLNDKLLFIKDLFNGYSLAYTEAIELLGRYDNFADADAFLQNNYAQKNNWASKQATVDKLYNILRQRFA